MSNTTFFPNFKIQTIICNLSVYIRAKQKNGIYMYFGKTCMLTDKVMTSQTLMGSHVEDKSTPILGYLNTFSLREL